MTTPHIVIVDNDKVWRRVYERWDFDLPSISKHVRGAPVPCIKILGVLHDLSPEQRKQVGWRYS